MKKLFVLVLSFFILPAAINIPILSAETLKIGVFDIQKIMSDSKTVDSYRRKLGKEIEAKKKVLLEKQETARQIDEKLRKEGQKMSSGDRKFQEGRLESEIRDLKRLKEDIDLDLQKMDRELTQKAFREIGDVVKKIADDEGYTIVFEKSAAGIIHFQNSVDITGKVIGHYDKHQ